MKLHALCCVLILSACASVTSSAGGPGASPRASARVGDVGTSEAVLSEPVRLESPAGTFLVHPNNAQDFKRLLAGEPTQQQYYSISDVP